MEWRGRRESDNVEDRRGEDGGGGSGGGGMRLPIGGGGGLGLVGMLVVAGVLWFGFGINPMFLFGLDGGSQQQTQSRTAGPPASGREDDTTRFVRVVLADTEDVWGRRFQSAGERYTAPTLVLFSGSTQSGCGGASAASGPFYCPQDRKLYLDMAFFRQLQGQLNSPGDFAEAYVVAHEVGHHIQNLTGILPAFDKARRGVSETEANAMSVRIELQADCYAGIWAHDTQGAGYIEAGDIDEALNAARQIGDDTLQKRSQGYAVPDSFNHGTSQQRSTWFKRGFESGDLGECDTRSGRL